MTALHVSAGAMNEPQPCDGNCERTPGLEAILEHLAAMANSGPDKLAEHLAGHGLQLRWDERSDLAVLRGYHHNTHDQQLQRARRQP